MTTTPNTRINLTDIDFPKFTEPQINFFREFISLLQQDRLNLDPIAVEPDLYKAQYMSLRGAEVQIQWIIDANTAVLDAELNERIHGKQYDPQAELLSGTESDVDMNIEDIVSLL